MSGSVAMPQPSIARTFTVMPGCAGKYVPIVQETESPKKSMIGSVLAGLPFRSIGTMKPADFVADGRGDTCVTIAAAGGRFELIGVVPTTMTTATTPTAVTVVAIGTPRGRSRLSAP